MQVVTTLQVLLEGVPLETEEVVAERGQGRSELQKLLARLKRQAKALRKEGVILKVKNKVQALEEARKFDMMSN